MNNKSNTTDQFNSDEELDDVVFEESTDFDDNEISNDESDKDKIKKLKETIKRLTGERDTYLIDLQRERAGSINFRRDEEAKRANLKGMIITNLCSQLLPVLDSFDAAMSQKAVWESVDKNWRVGIEYIHQQLLGVLKDNNVLEIEVLGKEYDTQNSEAHEYREVPDESQHDYVIDVLQKGYIMNGVVIRPARVIVGTHKS